MDYQCMLFRPPKTESQIRCRYFVLHVVLPVMLGGLIYTCWRKPTLLLFSWYRFIGLEPTVFHLRRSVVGIEQLLPNWMIFSLPDGLWVYAMTAFMAAVWGEAKFSRFGAIWTLSGLLLATGGEVAQRIGVVSGTFDVKDLFFCFLASTIAIAVGRHTHPEGRKKD